MEGHDEAVFEEPPNAFFEAWGRAVVRFRWPLLLATLALTATAAWVTATRIRVDTSIESFARNASDSQVVLEELRDEFGRDDLFLVLVRGDVFTIDFLTRLKVLHDELAALDLPLESLGERRADRDAARAAKKNGGAGAGAASPTSDPKPRPVDDFGFGGDDGWGAEKAGSIVERVTSLINIRKTRARPDGIEVGELMDPFPTEDQLPALWADVLTDETMVGQVIGPGGHHTVLAIQTRFMSEADSTKVEDAIEAVCDRHRAPGFDPEATGLPAMTKGLQTLMFTDLRRMLALSVALMVAMLAFLFRHPVGVLAPLAVVAMSALSTFAMMALADMPITMITNILPAFLICVGIGDSVHLMSVFRDHRRHGMDPKAAVVRTIATTGVPVFYTSLTTMVGLLSFRFASIAGIQEMGTAGAFGVGMAMLHSLVFLPIALSFTRRTMLGARPPHQDDFLDRFLERCLGLSGDRDDPGTGQESTRARRRRRRTLAAAVGLIACAVVGVGLLRVWHNPLSWIPPDKPVRATFEEMDDEIAGTASVSLLIDANSELGLKDAALLEGLEALEQHIRAYRDPDVGPIVGNSVSVLNVVKETHRVLTGGADDAYRLPDTQRGVADMLFMFENAGPDELRRLASADLARGQMAFRIRWMEATSYEPFARHIQEGIDKYIEAPAVVRPTGAVFTLVTTISSLIGDLLRSFTIAFVLIAIIMAVLLRSVRLGLVAMVPNLVPILFILGIMGFGGIPIDLINIMVASVAIGIAVDDTIHLLHHFRINHQLLGNVEESLRRAMRHSGRAMVSTSIILMVGFFAYAGATMYNVQRFGFLIGLTVVMALLVDLILSPALLRGVYRRDVEPD